MKLLPKIFIILSRDYIQPFKWSLKFGGITKSRSGKKVWFINETIAIYERITYARKAGRALAQGQERGYIENVKRGEVYTKKHRAEMYLYDR